MYGHEAAKAAKEELAFLLGKNVVVEVVEQDALRQSLCLLYTSDAADERSSVDLGGRRIIKKKKKEKKKRTTTNINKQHETRSQSTQQTQCEN